MSYRIGICRGRVSEKSDSPQRKSRICLRSYIGVRSSSVHLGVLGWTGEDWLKSQTFLSEEREFVFGLVKGYGVVQSIWEY